MLILSRRKAQSFMVADNIEVVVVEIHGDKVRLGIEAPKETPVHRKEVWEEIQRAKEAA